VFEGFTYLHSEERTNYPLTMSVEDLGKGFSLTTLARARLRRSECVR